MSAITVKELKGNTTQFNRLKAKIKIADKRNSKKLVETGIIVSLKISLKASAKGCNTPKKPTKLGPLLLCIEAITFRSNKVNSATDKIIGTIIVKL